MFIYNIKINGTKTMKIIIVTFILVALLILFLSIRKIFFNNKTIYVKDEISSNDVTEIQVDNYTNILKAVHDDLNSYEGMKIKFTGYVYKVLDLNANQFILARDMIVGSNYKAVVVGFLCEYDNAQDLTEGSWVEITGKITKGSYHNEEIPIIKILTLENTTPPQDEFVYPPDESYIPTSNMF